MFTGNRYRERSSPMPPGNRAKIGELNIVHKDTGALIAKYDDVKSASFPYPQWREKTWDYKHPGPPFLTGDAFANITVEFPHFTSQDSGAYMTDVFVGGSWRYRYDGGFSDPLWIAALDEVSDSQYFSIMIDSINASILPDLASLGSAAYARLRPSQERAGVGVALAEARDLPRMLSSTAKAFHESWQALGGSLTSPKMAPKKVANDFLNVQFGWIPFLSDLSRMDATWHDAHKYMSQIKRDNNKWVRRHRADKVIENETLLYSRTDIAGVTPANGGNFYGIMVPPYLYTIKLQELTEVWYEGVFKYYRPEYDDSIPGYDSGYGQLQRLRTLFGARISPTVIWRATPWSWAADWFTNAGDVIQRAEDWATDSLVSKYMYLMHHRRRRFELRSQFSTSDGRSHDIVWYRSADVKRRESADSHFSFSLSGALTPRQIAILAALGLSRKP